MNFMKSPITYKFSDSCQLDKTKYSYLVKTIQHRDLKEMNKILLRLHKDLKLSFSNFYINGKLATFKSDSFPGEIIQFAANQNWKLTIKVQGYKTTENGKPTPIITLIEAKKSF